MPRTRRLIASRPMSEWPRGDRPRERLREVGVRGLATRELLSLIVGSGGPTVSAMDVADALLRRSGGSLARMGSVPAGLLEGVTGVGGATAARVVAALELGRRAVRERLATHEPIRGPSDIYARMAPRLRDLRHEEFHVLLLNTQHGVLREVLITRGILDASLIHPREVLREAIVESAAAVILVHNHPSGNPSPSAEDREVTRQLSAAGRTVGIPILDHVIIAGGEFRSLAQDGLM